MVSTALRMSFLSSNTQDFIEVWFASMSESEIDIPEL